MASFLQASWNEVSIPFQKIEFDKNAVVRGRFGYVGFVHSDLLNNFLDFFLSFSSIFLYSF